MEMKDLVELCKRRGILFQSSHIYGGFNGFWDYGPLGVELKRNVKEVWWRDMVTAHDDIHTLPGAPRPFQMVGLDSAIIMNPQVWKCSGHYDLFHDFMVDCRESKKRYRHDQVMGRWVEHKEKRIFVAVDCEPDEALEKTREKALKFFNLRAKHAEELKWDGPLVSLATLSDFSSVLGPDAKTLGTLTPPREFNLMFKTIVGALGGEDDAAFLRPETAQGIFVNFKNVLDTSRVKIPFGIAQIGKSFRNEITPRNFTFRSREFEQMEIEFFCHPSESAEWYRYWRDTRYKWYVDLGLAGERLRLREHEHSELSHYSRGTADIEYAFPFLAKGDFGELEGIAHRGDFDLRSHMEGKLVNRGDRLEVETGPDGKPRHKGSGKDLSYFDDDGWNALLAEKLAPFQDDKERLKEERKKLEPAKDRFSFIPHVIEPSAGADRATLAFLCEAYREDKMPDEKGVLQERVYLKFHPRIAPIKAAVLPLVNKDGMPEIAQKLYLELKKEFNVFYDDGGAVGRRYRRQDEVGTPYCFTIDGDTLKDQTVTIRHRDTAQQHRIPLAAVAAELRQSLQ
jgi:glycyl-tRNA synthetase